MYRHDVISNFVNEIGNDMNNIFLSRWQAAEKAGEVSEADEFVKPFIRGTAREMVKLGWTKSPIKDVVLEHAELGSDDKAIFKLHVYGAINDNRSYAMTTYIKEGQLKEKICSMCFEEAAKLYRKQELTAKPADIAQ